MRSSVRWTIVLTFIFHSLAPNPLKAEVMSDNTRMKLEKTITGNISPKSVRASKTGVVSAHNMMYRHSVTTYDATSLELLSWTAFWFFMVIFFWTPPHFWALAIKYKDDYAAAGIPMLPVVAPIRKVSQQMWFHTIAMIVASFLTIYSYRLPGWSLGVAALLASLFIVQMKGLSSNTEKAASRIFNGSITYLSMYSTLLVVALYIP